MAMRTTFATPWDYAASGAACSRAPVVACGTRVTILRGIVMSEVWLVPDTSADQACGRIAVNSPLGRVLMGAHVGEAIGYEAGAGVEEIHVLGIAPAGA